MVLIYGFIQFNNKKYANVRAFPVLYLYIEFLLLLHCCCANFRLDVSLFNAVSLQTPGISKFHLIKPIYIMLKKKEKPLFPLIPCFFAANKNNTKLKLFFIYWFMSLILKKYILFSFNSFHNFHYWISFTNHNNNNKNTTISMQKGISCL